ncbi:MAG: sel1 repeat family protein [Rhizobiaceae bacterium]|nr:sel1 repeat family protein [Rhizobiaceae bacterium]
MTYQAMAASCRFAAASRHTGFAAMLLAAAAMLAGCVSTPQDQFHIGRYLTQTGETAAAEEAFAIAAANANRPQVRGRAAFELGQLRLRKGDRKGALAAFEQGAAAGNSDSLNIVLDAMLERNHLPANLPELLPELIRRAESGTAVRHAQALALIYGSPRYGLADRAEADKWLTLAAERGSSAAQRTLAFRAANASRDSEADRFLRMAAEGRPLADMQCRVARGFANGEDGLQRSASLARKWERRAGKACLPQERTQKRPSANQAPDVTPDNFDAVAARARGGDAEAAFRVARYLDRSADAAERPKALEFHAIAVRSGRADALAGLRRAIVATDPDANEARQAIAALQSAATSNRSAQVILGDFHRRGVGVPRSASEAIGWYTKAADAGSADGMFNLGSMLLTGEGTAIDVPRAKALLERAKAAGHPLAATLLQQIAQATP